MMEFLNSNAGAILLATFIIWESIWKGLGIWYAIKDNKVCWFLAIFILNTVGILPIIYLVFFSKSAKLAWAKMKKAKKKR